jgi:hypothetical protein
MKILYDLKPVQQGDMLLVPVLWTEKKELTIKAVEIYSETLSEAQPEIQPEGQPEVQVEEQPEIQLEAQPEIQLEAQPEIQSEAQSEAPSKVQPEGQLEVQVEAQPEIQLEAQSEAPSEVQVEAQLEIQLEAQSEAPSEVQPEGQPEVQVEEQPEVQPEAQSKAPSEVQVEGQPEVQVQGQPEVVKAKDVKFRFETVERLYYECEVVLSKSLLYKDLKKAIETQLEPKLKNKALGLLPKTIEILTKPSYDLSTWEGVKTYRNALLAESDWTQLPDAPCIKEEWVVYRQLLRDIPTNFSCPSEVVFPQKP